MRILGQPRFVATTLFYVVVILSYWITVPPTRPTTIRIAEITIVVLYGLLSLIALSARPADRQVAAFTLTGSVVSLSMVLPTLGVRFDPPGLFFALLPLQHLIYIGGPAVFIAMAALIPDPNPLLQRRRSDLRAVCTVFFASAVITLALHTAGLALGPAWPLHIEPWLRRITLIGYTLGGGVILGILAHSSLRAPTAGGRAQALVVLCGVTPWVVRAVALLFAPQSVYGSPFFLPLDTAVVLLVPISFFIAVFGFQLFDLGLFIRKSLIYGVTVAIITGTAYGAWLGAGVLASRALGLEPNIWNIALVLVLLGVAARPLLRRITNAVDHLFFPEKIALRRLQEEIIPDLAGSVGLDEVARRLVRRLREGLGLQTAALLVATDEGELFRTRAAVGTLPGGTTASGAVVTRESLERWSSLRTDEPFARKDSGDEDRELRTMLDLLDTRYVVPIVFEEELSALLLLGPLVSGTELDKSDRKRLGVLAHGAAAMLENVRLHDLAVHDSLTRLPRRQVFEERLTLELSRIRRTFRPLTVGIADLDDFKRLNDTYGHLVGDLVLKHSARLLMDGCRSVDLVARFGGEEFVLLLPDTSIQGAVDIAEKLRREVCTATLLAPAGTAVSVTISIGLYEVRPADIDAEAGEVLRRADEALYRAKAAGKNRVEVFSDPSP